MTQRSLERVLLALTMMLSASTIAPVAQGQAMRVATPRDFTDYREASDAQLSPDGRFIAFVVEELADTTARGRKVPCIWLVATTGNAGPRRLTPPGRAATLPRWSPDSRGIAFLSQNQIHLQDIEGGTRQISKSDGSIGDFTWSPDGAEIAYVSSVAPERAPRNTVVTVVRSKPAAGSGYRAISLLSVKDGTTRRITNSDLNIRELTWSPDSKHLAVLASGSALGGSALAVIDRNGAVQRRLADNPGSFGTRRQMLDWSPDGASIVFAKMSKDEVGHWIGLVPAAGGPAREMLADYGGTVMRVVWGADSRHLVAQSFEKLSSHLLRIDAASGKVTRLAELYTSYPDFTMSDDGRVIGYVSETNKSPMDVWTYKVGDLQPRRLTQLNPQVAELRLGEVKPFTWRSSRDNVELHGVLVTPPGYESNRKWPTIVQIHGGPHFHWGLGWLGDWHDWAQLLASNGYVVLLPNPRGSTGMSWSFASAIGRDVGGIDYQDIMDGTDALLARGIADPAQLGVGGWSFGGYLTAWTITQTNRFKAAVVGAGISNFFSHAGQPASTGRADIAFRFGGEPYDDRKGYDDRSPIMHVRKVKTPTLLVHGEVDAKISPAQAWEFFTALKVIGVESQLALYPRTGHGITDREQQADYLQRVLCWYDSHLRNRTAPECSQ